MAWQDWLDWEENVFRGLLAGWRRMRSAVPREEAGGTAFETHAAPLSVLAQLLAGEPVRLRRAQGAGGLRGADLLLPARMDLGGGAQLDADALRAQVVVLAGLRRLRRGHRAPPDDSYEGALAALQAAREAADLMERELPGFRELHARVRAQVLATRGVPDALGAGTREADLERARQAALRGDVPWDDPALRARLVGPRSGRHRSPPLPVWGEWLTSPEELDPGVPCPLEPDPDGQPATEAEAPDVGALRRVDLPEPEEEQAPPSAPFERAETLDAYRGGHRDLDGSDELEAQLEALEQVELGDLFRGNQTAQSLLKADLELGADIADARETAGEGGIAYDEWDARRRRYRKGWCTVYPDRAPLGDTRWASERLHEHRELVRRLRHRLEAHRAGLRAVPRQLDGEDIDLEAALDDHVARTAGRAADPRLYVQQAKRRRDFATTVLLDVSMSTDSWVDGRRILDVAREATLVLGEVAHGLGDRIEVLAFASETRNRCHVWRVCADGEPWTDARRRLAALVPRGYTRIGPALRHATDRLASTPAERRLLLLLSDGKPTDYDRYEGRYGVADVRQAIREAHDREIHTHALAIDAVARDYLPALFGQGGWHVLPQPDHLVEALTAVYGRLTAR